MDLEGGSGEGAGEGEGAEAGPEDGPGVTVLRESGFSMEMPNIFSIPARAPRTAPPAAAAMEESKEEEAFLPWKREIISEEAFSMRVRLPLWRRVSLTRMAWGRSLRSSEEEVSERRRFSSSERGLMVPERMAGVAETRGMREEESKKESSSSAMIKN